MSIPNRPVGCGQQGHAGRAGLAAALCALAWGLPAAAVAQQAPTVYRCPGPPVLYADTLTPAEARSKNCKPLTDLPVAVAPKPALAPVAALSPLGAAGGGPTGAAPTAGAAAASLSQVDTRVRPDDQRSRDTEARRILEAELRREEARLNDAVKASATAKPGERVGADAAQIRRAESDIEAIRRELGRLR